MKISLKDFLRPQPKKLEIYRYQYVPPEDKTGIKQGKEWDCFNAWKHLFNKSFFSFTPLNYFEGKKVLKEIKIANSQSPNKMRIWMDEYGTIKGIK